MNPEFELQDAIEKIRAGKSARETHWRYYEGDHADLPYAPEGASEDYMELRKMSPVPLVRMAVRTPAQRLRAKGVNMKSADLSKRHRLIWQKNKLDSGQRIPFTHAMVYGEGYMSVWPNPRDVTSPTVRAEDPNLIWLERDSTDPLRVKWGAKVWSETVEIDGKRVTKDVGVLYHDDEITRLERLPGTFGEGKWEVMPGFPVRNPFGRVPIVPFMADLDSKGRGYSLVKPLIPMQRAIDTMRFDLLLAAQFAAYKQRVATGYDPVQRDNEGNPIWRRYPEGHAQAGEIMMDEQNGLPMPVIVSPGRVGVDRLLAFPGVDTKIFDLAESNLENYVTGLQMLYATFASAAQMPPSYMVSDFANTSGDLVVATEATLRSFLDDLQVSFGESLEDVHQLIGKATGDETMVDEEAEMVWQDTGPVSLVEVADFASKMVPLGYPMVEVVQKLPGISQNRAEAMDLTPPAPPAPPPSETPPGGEPPANSAEGDPPPRQGATNAE